jgi:hypothetical protein
VTEHEQLADAFREQRKRLLHGLAEQSPASPLVWTDLPGYESPVTGAWVEGRAQRREDLKRSGCREYDPGMKDDAKRNHQANNERLDRIIGEGAQRVYNQMPDYKRKAIDKAVLTMDVDFVRRHG